jgi:hypothetical protein
MFSIPPPPPLLVVDYNLLFMLFSFVRREGMPVCPGAVLDFAPRVWVGKSHVCMTLTCSFCRFTQAALKQAGRGKWHGVRRLFTVGLQDVAEFYSD